MIYYVLIIILSIILHEMGHLVASLLFKVKVKAFSIGFGKILWHKEWKGIDWRISLIPLGGYCDIEESIDKENSLINIAYWKQVIILLAGVSLNFLIACICYLIQFSSITKGIIVDLFILKYIFLRDYTSIAPFINDLNLNFYLIQLSFLNLFVAITNLIPFPSLDGGYLWIFPLRRKMSEKFYKRLIGISFYLLMIGQVVLIY